MIELSAYREAVRRQYRAEGRQRDLRRRQRHRAGRPVGRRQVDAAALHQPSGNPDFGPRADRRRGDRLPARRTRSAGRPSSGCGGRPAWCSRISSSSRTAPRIDNVSEGADDGAEMAEGKGACNARSNCSKRSGLAHKADAWPATLSGGQQQRVAIARALAPSPSVLLCDEPTSALDPELAGEVVEVLAQLAREGTTMVIATHDLRLASTIAHEAIFLDAGVVVEKGPARRHLQQARARAHQALHRDADADIQPSRKAAGFEERAS